MALEQFDENQPRKVPTPDEVFGSKKVPSPSDVFGDDLKKKEPTPLASSVTPLPYQDKFKQGLAFAQEGYKTPIASAVKKDIQKEESTTAAIYNTLVGSVKRLAGGAAYMAEVGGLMGGRPEAAITRLASAEQARQKTEQFVEKARSEKASKEYEQQLKQFDVTPQKGGGLLSGIDANDFKALAFQAPSQALDMLLGSLTGGGSFVAQSISDAANELNQSGIGTKLNDAEKATYIFTQAAAQAALEKYGLDKILKNTGLGKAAKQKIANEITDEFVKKGVKATADDIVNAATKKASSFASVAKRVGVKTAVGIAAEGGTEGAQTAAQEGIKLLTNKIVDKDVFNEDDIIANLGKNIINSSVAGGAFGSMAGAFVGGLQNTNKAIRDEVAKAGKKFIVDGIEVSEDEFNAAIGNKKVVSDITNIQNEINKQVEEGNITPQEAEAANITAQQYAEIAGKIPTTISPQDKYKIIGGIEQREALNAQKQQVMNEMTDLDPVFKKEKQDQIDLIQAKINETNDYLEGIVSGKKPEYKEKRGMYFKVDSEGQETPISKETYDLATSIREEDARKAETAIDDFANRIASGEKMESPEDLQFYENNKKEIEKALQAKADKTKPTVIMPEENIPVETTVISPRQQTKGAAVVMPEANVAPEVAETVVTEEKVKPTEVKKEVKTKIADFKTKFAPKPKEVSVSAVNAAQKRVDRQQAAKIEPTDARGFALSWMNQSPDVLDWNSIKDLFGGRKARLNIKEAAPEEIAKRDYVAKKEGDTTFGEKGVVKTLNDVVNDIWNNLPDGLEDKITTRDIKDELEALISEYPTRAEAARALIEHEGGATGKSLEEQQMLFEERKGEVSEEELEPIEFEGGFVPFEEDIEGLEEAPFAVQEAASEEVAAMQDIVKDYINEGTTSLSEIKKAITKELGYNTRKLRQTIEDAYNEYTATAEAAVTEVKSGLLGRVGNAFGKMFGKEAQKPFIAKDGKALSAKAKNVAETGGRPSFQITMPNGQLVTAKPVDASVVNGFYSPLELQLNQMKQDKMPAKQWLDKLRGEEAKWSGLSDWLSQQKESLTKDQIKNYLDTNKVEIFEIVKGAPNKLNEDQIRRLKYLEKLDKENPGGAIEDIEKGVFKDSSYDELMYLLNVRDASSYESLFEAQLEAEKKARIAQQAGLKKKAEEYWDDSHRYTKRIEILELSPDGEGGIENPTKFSKYQLEGEKSDYREILITQPQKTILKPKDDVYYNALAKLSELEKEQDNVNKRYNEFDNKIENLRDARGLVDDIDRKNEINDKIQNLKIKRGEVYLEYSELGDKIFDQNEILNQYKKKLEDPKFLYTTHFDEANILVHLRTNMRKDVDGNTVFFAEEIQSDWGQQGRERGFKAESLTDKEKERLNELKDITSKKYAEFSFLQDAYQYSIDLGYGDYSYKNTEEFNQFLKSDENYRKEIINERRQQREKFYNNLIQSNKLKEENAEIREAIVKSLEKQKSDDYEKYIEALFNIKRDSFDYDLYKKEVGEKGLLEEKKSKGEYGHNIAPFVTKTSDWTKLGIKSLLKEAVKSGASRFAWTNGDQQNDRWSLSKYIDELQVFRNGDDEFQLVGFNNGNSDFEQNVKSSQLEDYVGKELAVKVLNDFATNKDMNDKTYSDTDFKIDGVGMRSFYGDPSQNKLGLVGDIVKSLFKQTPKKLELKGSSKIEKLKDQLKDKKDQLFLLRKDIEILNKNPKYLEELQVRSNMLREEYFKNEDELGEVKQKIYKNTQEREQINDIIYGKFFDERTLQINKEIDKYLNYEKEIKSNREYQQWNNELDRLANEKKEIIKEYVNKSNENDKEYRELTVQADELRKKSNLIEGENVQVKNRLKEIKDAPFNEKKILKKIKYFEDEISKGVPSQWYVDITPELKAQVEVGLPLFMANPSGADILGFSFGNRMYLNGEKLNPNTIIHEAGHIWTEWVKNNDYNIYAKGMELVEKSPYLQKAKTSKFYQEQAAKLATEQEKEEYFKHEALAMAIGDKGAQFVVESKKESFKDWLKTLWNKIKSLTGFKDLTEEQFQNLTFEEFSKMAVKEILGVENDLDKFQAARSIKKKKDFVKSKVRGEANKNAIDDFEVDDMIKLIKADYDLQTLKNIKDAIQKPSPEGVLQYPQEGVGETRSERRRMERAVKREEAAGKSQEVIPAKSVEKKQVEKNEKSILKKIYESENISESVKEKFKDDLKYKTASQAEAKKIAKEIIKEYGYDEAVKLAEENRFADDVNTFLFSESVNEVFLKERDALTPEEKAEYAEQWADYARRFDEAMRGKGRAISAIYDFVKKSPLGIVIAENRNRNENFKKWLSNKEENYKELFNNLINEPEFKEIISEEVQKEIKKERAAARQKKRQKIEDFFNNAKLKGNDLYLVPIPPQVINGALEVMKKAVLAGESIGYAVEQAIKHISKDVETWDSEKFRSEYESKLANVVGEEATRERDLIKSLEKRTKELERRLKEKDFSAEEYKEKRTLNEKEEAAKENYDEVKKAYDEAKKKSPEYIEKKSKQYLDRFRNKMKGLNDKQKEDIIMKSSKRLIENGALEYDDFKQIVADALGLGELTTEQVKKITDLTQKTNKVDEFYDLFEKEENITPENLSKYKKAKKEGELASTELSQILNKKVNIVNRLLSMVQLGTLGSASLALNVAYNVTNQALLRFPIGVQLSVLDKILYGTNLLKKNEFLPENDIVESQKEFFRKGWQGTKMSVDQLFTGLTNKDYFQKELFSSQIHPFTSAKELYDWGKGEKTLSKEEVADKVLQASPGGIVSAVIARLLNIGDKPLRFAAEGAKAASFSDALGLKGIDREFFLEMPKQMAYIDFKKKGLSDEVAMKKAEEIEQSIIKSGEEAVFQQDNLITTFIEEGIQAVSRKSEITGAAIKIIKTMNMPYLKTPLNVAWSIYNLINPEIAIAQSVGYAFRAYKTKSPLDIQASKKWLAHAATGAALMAVAGFLSDEEIINANNGNKTSRKERKGEQTYEQQNSLNITKLMALIKGEDPNKVENSLNVDLKWFGAAGNILNLQATKLDEMTKEQRKDNLSFTENLLMNLDLSTAEMVENGVFSNSASLMQALTKGGGYGDAYVLNLINLGANVIQPAVFAQMSRAQLPYYSEIKADSFLGEVKNNALARSGLLRSLTGAYPPSKVGVWGDTLERNDNLAMKIFGISSSNKDNFAQPLYEDYKRTNNIKFLPPSSLPEINNIKLDASKAKQFEILVGKARKTLITPFVNDGAILRGFNNKYSNLNDEQKINALEVLYKQGYENAKNEFIKLYPEFYKPSKKTKEEKKESRISRIFRRSIK